MGSAAASKKKSILRHSSLRNSLAEFRNKRELVKTLDAEVKTQQPELCATLDAADPDGVGVIFDPTNQEKGAAFHQQNAAGEFWKTEQIISWLKENKKWNDCSSRVFDQRKWEAEIAAGNIPKAVARKFKQKGAAPAPFVRFGKITEESL